MYSLYEVEGIAILIFIFHLQNILIMTKISENPDRMTALLKTPRVFKSKGNLKTVTIKRNGKWQNVTWYAYGGGRKMALCKNLSISA